MTSLSASPLIDLKQVSLSLPAAEGMTNILHGLSFKIHKNETIAVTGPSGSGKTSLLMVIAGLEVPTSGKVTVCGEELGGQSEDALARFRGRNIGIVFQSFHLIRTMTALENVALPLEFAGETDAIARAKEALGALGLTHRLHHYPAQLSGGEQQRVAIARAFVARPALLLADEPTGNLDGETGEQVIRLLFDLQKKYGTTLLLITHDPALAKRCDRVLHMIDGKIT